MLKNKSLWEKTIVVLFIGICAILMAWWMIHLRMSQKAMVTRQTSYDAVMALNSPREIADFTLTTSEGKPFTLENLKGKWTLMFFGFTRCPNICPTTLTTLKDVYLKLQSDKVNPLPQIVFISVDPENDTLPVLEKYIHSFNTAFIGATGKEEEIDKLTEQLSIVYSKVQQKSDADTPEYMIDHSGTVVLINPDQKIQGFFSMPHQMMKMVKDYQKIVTPLS